MAGEANIINAGFLSIWEGGSYPHPFDSQRVVWQTISRSGLIVCVARIRQS